MERLRQEISDEDFEILAVSVDLQGTERTKTWVDKSGSSYTTAIDAEAVVAAMFEVRYVPFSVLIDEEGRVVRGARPVDVSRDEHRAEIASWIEGKDVLPSEGNPMKARESTVSADPEARLRFSRGALLQKRGLHGEAVVQLYRALALDPSNWIIHKQIWAIRHPDRFYDGGVDFDWQREQLARERREEKSQGP